MNKKVLITGASGFVGFHLINECLDRNFEVHAAVRPSSDIRHLQGLPVNFVNADFARTDALTKQIESGGYQYIIHAAGVTKAKTKEQYDGVNADFTRNLAKAAVQANTGLKSFVFLSSLAARGPWVSGKAAPVTSYGRSKLLAEHYLQEQAPLPSTVLRPTAVYGPRERDLFILIQSLNRGIDAYIGNEEQKLSFIYVKDLAAVTVNALELPGDPKKRYSVADGKTYNRYHFADVAKRLLRRKPLRVHLPYGAVKILASLLEKASGMSGSPAVLNRDKLNELTAADWSCDIREAQDDLGFNPGYHLENGLEETINWYKENGWL